MSAALMSRVIGSGLLAVALGGPVLAADKPEDAAQSGAESWLKLVDARSYDASWDAAAKLFKQAVTKEQWNQAASAARGPLGALVSRKVKSRKYTETIPGGPDGKYVILEYDSVFEKKSSAVETVVPMVDPDGAWRVSGYFIR
jgi:uncharacterized protein DUF4019